VDKERRNMRNRHHVASSDRNVLGSSRVLRTLPVKLSIEQGYSSGLAKVLFNVNDHSCRTCHDSTTAIALRSHSFRRNSWKNLFWRQLEPILPVSATAVKSWFPVSFSKSNCTNTSLFFARTMAREACQPTHPRRVVQAPHDCVAPIRGTLTKPVGLSKK